VFLCPICFLQVYEDYNDYEDEQLKEGDGYEEDEGEEYIAKRTSKAWYERIRIP
jgi:hypothetical protein